MSGDEKPPCKTCGKYGKPLLFMVNGGLGDAAELTRILIVALRLMHQVDVLVVGGNAAKMIPLWAQLPGIFPVNRDTAAGKKYHAILCPTSTAALQERAKGLTAEIISNGHPTGSIIRDWQNLLVAIGHPLEQVRKLMPRDPLKHLLPKVPRKDLILIAPGVGRAALHAVKSGQKPDKRYAHWAEVIRYLGRPIAITGDASAREPWMAAFAKDKDIVNLIGQDDGPETLLPLLARTRLLFAPDNGMGHLARLFGIPTVSIFSTTDPRKYAAPDAVVLVDDGKLRPGDVANEVHHHVNPQCRQSAPEAPGPMLSVIITTHNEGDEVALTVEDFQLRTGCPVEIIVVDDASTDGSCAALPPSVKVIRNGERLGVAPSRNRGAAAATGAAFMFPDAHMRTTPGIPARMMQAALDRRAIIVPGLAPLYNLDRGAVWVCRWEWHSGRLRSIWRGDCGEDFTPTPSFVGPGWVIARREWDKLGPWPASLRHWGSTEVCKSLQACMTGTPMLCMRDAVLWHRFRNRFPYRASPKAIMQNAYVTANVMFGDQVFGDVLLPAMKLEAWGGEFEDLLKSDPVRQDVAEFAKRRTLDPAEFFRIYFPSGIIPARQPQESEHALAIA